MAPILLALVVCGITLATLGDYGITWDENFYFPASDARVEWLKQPSLATIDQYWSQIHERPPMLIVLSGLGKFLFHDVLGVVSTIVGYRLCLLIFVFALCWTLYTWAAELYGDLVALIVTLSFTLMPRVFFHAHIAAIDYTITAMSLLVAYAYWKEARSRKWPWVTAILLGLTMLTKINGLFLYAPLMLYWAYLNRHQILWRLYRQANFDPEERKQCYLRLIPLYTIPFVMWIAGWPWLWHHTLDRILENLLYHARYTPVHIYYLGTTYLYPPWHYPFVQILATTPLITIVTLIGGLMAITLRRAWDTYLWIGLNAALTIGMLISKVPKYDGVRLMLPAFPFLCLLAGAGLYYGVQLIRPAWARKLALGSYLLLLLVSAYFGVVRTHPYQSSYYSKVVGGVDGAVQRLGLEADYWGNSYRGLLPWMNEHNEETVWLFRRETDPYLLNAFDYYIEDGLLQQPVRSAGKDSTYVILLIRQGFFTEEMWSYYTEEEPVFAVRLSNTILAGIYRLRH
jgi:4-amino-4-deoxy-L-arabinose transferase-like glycosyltransferase